MRLKAKKAMVEVFTILLMAMLALAQPGCKKEQEKGKEPAAEKKGMPPAEVKPNKNHVKFTAKFLDDGDASEITEFKVFVDGTRCRIDLYESRDGKMELAEGILLDGKQHYEINFKEKRIGKETLSDEELQKLMRDSDFVLPRMDFELIKGIIEDNENMIITKVGTEKYKDKELTRYEVTEPNRPDTKILLLVDEYGMVHLTQDLGRGENGDAFEMIDLDYAPKFTDDDFKLPEGYEIIEKE